MPMTRFNRGKERPIGRRIVRFGQIHFPSDAENVHAMGHVGPSSLFKSHVMTSSLNPNTSPSNS